MILCAFDLALGVFTLALDDFEELNLELGHFILYIT